VGQSARLAVAVEHIRDLAAFETELSWDPRVFTVDAVEIGDFLGSTGRRVLPVEPLIDNDAGRLVFGAATLGDQPGPSGGGVLFHLELTGGAIGRSRLGIEGSALAEPGGAEIEHARSDGAVSVGECMVGDFDCNCIIDIRDVMAVVRRWGAVEGDPDYDPLYDMDADGDIDIVDVQIEAGLWGRRCDDDPGAADAAAPDSAAREAETGPKPGPSAVQGSPVEPEAAQAADAVAENSAGRTRGDAGTDSTPPRAVLRPAGAVVDLTAEPMEPRVGDVVTVGIAISDSGEVAGFELEVAFDPRSLRFVEARMGGFLSSTGRTVVELGPTQEGGAVSFGALSLPGAPAPSGSGRLAELSFEVVAAGHSTVEVIKAITVDTMDTSAQVVGGTVTITALPQQAITGWSFVPLAIDG
jgi:hypothetical protein